MVSRKVDLVPITRKQITTAPLNRNVVREKFDAPTVSLAIVERTIEDFQRSGSPLNGFF